MPWHACLSPTLLQRSQPTANNPTARTSDSLIGALPLTTRVGPGQLVLQHDRILRPRGSLTTFSDHPVESRSQRQPLGGAAGDLRRKAQLAQVTRGQRA